MISSGKDIEDYMQELTHSISELQKCIQRMNHNMEEFIRLSEGEESDEEEEDEDD